MNKSDLTGQTIGSLKVLEEFSVPFEGADPYRKTKLKLKCECACGKIFFPYKTNVTSGKTSRCSLCNNCHDLFDHPIGQLRVIRRVPNAERTLECECTCGRIYVTTTGYLRKGKNPRCGHCRYPKKFARLENAALLTRKEFITKIGILKHLKERDALVGKKFGFLKVLGFSHWKQEEERKRPFYYCFCKCKKVVELRGDQIKSGLVQSCGCLQKEKILKGEDQPGAKLKSDQVSAIRSLLKSGLYSQREVAAMFRVSEYCISGIKNNKIYKDV